MPDTAPHPKSLQDQFGIPGALRFAQSAGGLDHAVISTPLAEADIYLQGGHIALWKPAGHQPVLFMSSRSLFTPGKAIRGGVPVIFPWFGARSDGQPGPQHGYARSSLWTVESTSLTDSGVVEITLALESIRLSARIGASLKMELQVRNDSPAPFTFEEALHTYLAISGIHNVTVSGLEGTTFIDKTDGFQRKLQPAEPVRCTKETDQVHLNTAATCEVHDPAWNRRLIIAKTGSASTIVWNPWAEKAAGMSDMGPGEWEQMICVESGNAADNAITLAPGATHTLTATISVA